MAAVPASLFSALLDHSFKGVSFPSTRFELDIRHDLAEHKFLDKDGAEIEATGRAPLEFKASIPFINGLQKGPHELWETPLYPNVYRQFIDAIANKATGTLNHPEFGPIQVKTVHAHTVWDGTAQGGVFVDVVWRETVLNVQDALAFLASTSPTAQLGEAAALLDAVVNAKSFTVPSVPKLPAAQTSLTDMVNSIRTIVDYPSLLNQQVGGRIDAMAASAKALGAALDKSSSPLNWPLVNAVQKIVFATNGLRETILAKKRAIGLFPVGADATLVAVATQIPADLSDIFSLNPGLLRFPVVARGTIVRHYAKAA